MNDRFDAPPNAEGEASYNSDSPQSCDVLVTGTSLPALLAALECAEVGLSVWVIDRSDDESKPNGSFGFRDDEWLHDPEGDIARVIERINIKLVSPSNANVTPTPHAHHADEDVALDAKTSPTNHVQRRVTATPMLWSERVGWFSQSEPNVLGMPAVVLASENVHALGWRGALRGYVDRLKPLLTLGKTRTVADLVRQRFGKTILSQLVEPHIVWKFGQTSDKVDVAIAAPGLNETLSRTGALSSAVLAYSERNVARETSVRPAEGWINCAHTFRHKLEMYGVKFVAQSATTCQLRNEHWKIEFSDNAELTSRAVIVDCDSQFVETSMFSELTRSLMPTLTRLHARVDIQALPGLDESATGLRIHESWALKISPDLGGHRRVHFISNAAPKPQLTHDNISAVLSSIGAIAFENASVAQTQSAAPFATVEQKHVVESELHTVTAAQPSLVPVGSTITGADLGAALQHSHRLSLQLRRDLLGL